MIHTLQVLCGPARHAICAMMYDDAVISPQEVREGVEALIEMQVDHQIINRRCEICDAPIKDFWYEDGITKEQEWEKVKEQAIRSEAEQTATRIAVQAARRAGKN
jgi:hypothetical protein